MDPKIVGERVKILMKLQRISEEEMAEKMNLRLNELIDLLDGKNEFNLSQMKRLKDILGLDVKASDELFFGDEFNAVVK